MACLSVNNEGRPFYCPAECDDPSSMLRLGELHEEDFGVSHDKSSRRRQRSENTSAACAGLKVSNRSDPEPTRSSPSDPMALDASKRLALCRVGGLRPTSHVPVWQSGDASTDRDCRALRKSFCDLAPSPRSFQKNAFPASRSFSAPAFCFPIPTWRSFCPRTTNVTRRATVNRKSTVRRSPEPRKFRSAR